VVTKEEPIVNKGALSEQISASQVSLDKTVEKPVLVTPKKVDTSKLATKKSITASLGQSSMNKDLLRVRADISTAQKQMQVIKQEIQSFNKNVETKMDSLMATFTDGYNTISKLQG